MYGESYFLSLYVTCFIFLYIFSIVMFVTFCSYGVFLVMIIQLIKLQRERERERTADTPAATNTHLYTNVFTLLNLNRPNKECRPDTYTSIHVVRFTTQYNGYWTPVAPYILSMFIIHTVLHFAASLQPFKHTSTGFRNFIFHHLFRHIAATLWLASDKLWRKPKCPRKIAALSQVTENFLT